MTDLSAPRQKQLKLKPVSDPVSKSHSDNFLHLDEDLKLNSFKSFAARERMVLLANKKYPSRPLRQAENEAEFGRRRRMDGDQKQEVTLMDGLPGTFAREVPGYSELCVFY